MEGNRQEKKAAQKNHNGKCFKEGTPWKRQNLKSLWYFLQKTLFHATLTQLCFWYILDFLSRFEFEKDTSNLEIYNKNLWNFTFLLNPVALTLLSEGQTRIFFFPSENIHLTWEKFCLHFFSFLLQILNKYVFCQVTIWHAKMSSTFISTPPLTQESIIVKNHCLWS